MYSYSHNISVWVAVMHAYVQKQTHRSAIATAAATTTGLVVFYTAHIHINDPNQSLAADLTCIRLV